MGVDRNLLKDVLMIDMLSTSIGLKCFTQASSEISASNSKSDEMFETILMRGVRLPVTNSKLFRLASSKQKLVTVEAFEEVEEASEGGTEVVLQWQYMGTFTCVVPKSCRGQSVGANTHEDLGKYVSITFNMNEFGELSIGISPPNALRSKVAEQEIVEVDTTTTNIFGVDSAVLKKAGENSDKKVEVRIGSIDEVEEFDEESTRTINFLIGVMIFLTAIYLFTKLFILDKSLLDFDFLSSSESFRDDSNSQELNSGENSALPSVDESEF